MINKFNGLIRGLEQSHPQQVGLFYGFLSTILFFSLSFFAKLYNQINYSQISFIRFFYLFIINYIVGQYNNISLIIPKKKIQLVTLRNILGFQVTLGLFWGVTKVPITQTTIILQLGTILIPIADKLIYNTKYTLRDLFLSMLAFSGVVLCVQSNQYSNNDIQYVHGFEKIIVLCVLFISLPVGWSFSAVLVKSLKEINAITMNLQFSFIGTTFCALLMIINEVKPISLQEFIELSILIGIVGFFSQHFFIKSYQLARSGSASILNTLFVVYAFLVEILYFDEKPQLTSVIGSIITLIAVFITLFKGQ